MKKEADKKHFPFSPSVFLAALAAVGCANNGTPAGTPEVQAPPAHARGAVEAGGVRTLDNFPSLVSDHRAYGVGQSVTVLILEEASSTTRADTQSAKSLDLSGSLEKTSTFDGGSLNLENSAAGSGSINREGRLTASVSATVQEVLPGGELLIRGEQRIEFNNEIQHIRVAGRIRPEDIASNNTVLSSRIAGAEISYVGDGLLGSRQKPGLFTRVINWLF